MYKTEVYRDGQVTAKILEDGNLKVEIRGNSYQDLFEAASIKEAWDEKNKLNKHLTSELWIWCLIGQRSDRRFGEGQSFDLIVIARFINSMSFDTVKVFHPHSSVSLALIENSEVISHFPQVKQVYETLNKPVLVSPDAGAYKTTHEIAEKLNASLVPSNKVRINGQPSIQIQGDVDGQDCLIVDDLADGGRTFQLLALSLKKQGANKVYLYVSHGQFNHGFEELKQSIDHIYCTNSYRDIEDMFVTQLKVLGGN